MPEAIYNYLSFINQQDEIDVQIGLGVGSVWSVKNSDKKKVSISN